MNKLTESELAVFDGPASLAPATQATADDWGWGEDAPGGPVAVEMVQTQCDAGHLHGKKPKGTRIKISECPACKLLGIGETAVVIPSDAPLNDATLPPPEKKTRKARAPKAVEVQVADALKSGVPFDTVMDAMDKAIAQVTPASVPAALRDEFAAAALAGLCALEMYQSHPCGALAENAYAIADAMLKARG